MASRLFDCVFNPNIIERLVIDQIKSKILDVKYVGELVNLVNVELDADHVLIKEQIANTESEIQEVENRLPRQTVPQQSS